MNKVLENKQIRKILNVFSSENLSKYFSTLEKPKNMGRFKMSLWGFIFLFMFLGFFIPAPHEYAIEALEKIPIFYSVFGFIACISIVVIAKTIGHFLLERKEDYYDK